MGPKLFFAGVVGFEIVGARRGCGQQTGNGNRGGACDKARQGKFQVSFQAHFSSPPVIDLRFFRSGPDQA
jgi:hypothetical protein